MFNGILRRQSHERRRQGKGLAFNGDLPFLHHFQQRRLGLGRGAVDLVGQQEVAEHRPPADFKPFLAQVVQGMAGHIAGHQIGGELDAGEPGVDAGRQGPRQQGFAQTRHALDQDMTGGAQGDQRLFHHRLLTDQRPADFSAQGLQ